MMRLPAFRRLAPEKIEEASQALADFGPQAQIVSGGTDLYPNMKRRQITPQLVVSLHRIKELKQVRRDRGTLVVGAGVTLTQLINHTFVREYCPALAQAAGTISTPLLRNMGTIGGNLCLDTRCHFLNQSFFWRQAVGSCMKAENQDVCLVAPGSPRCWAITSADLPPLLIALQAQVTLTGVQGERSVALSELYQDDGVRYLNKAADEIVTQIQIPEMSGCQAGYLKLRRRGTFDFPTLGVAAAFRLDSSDVCREARIVLGAIASRPLEVAEASLLVGEKITSEKIQQVAQKTMRRVKPMHLADYSAAYRKRMVATNTARLLTQLGSKQVEGLD